MKISKIDNDKFICDNPNLVIISFDEIFKKVVIHVINIIYNIYGDLNLIKTLNSDVKKIFIHSILDQIYERIIKENDVNTILFINTNFTNIFSEIWTYIDKEKLEQFIIKTCKTISHKTPIPILITSEKIDLLNITGETIEIINKLDHTLNEFRNHTTSINQLKKYSKVNGLIHFIDKYHSDDNVKNNMFYNKYLKGAHNE
ncbi:MAG: hypothetical protein PHS54_00355 [Clostridia bacterium]|nr:hypothetical protein [Clostridia bacterium]